MPAVLMYVLQFMHKCNLKRGLWAFHHTSICKYLLLHDITFITLMLYSITAMDHLARKGYMHAFKVMKMHLSDWVINMAFNLKSLVGSIVYLLKCSCSLSNYTCSLAAFFMSTLSCT